METATSFFPSYFEDLWVRHRITKPVEGTVKVYLDGLEAFTSWSVDYSTGIITFNTAPESNVQIICIFEFDIPVWFETDEFSYKLEGYQKAPQTEQVQAIYRLGNLAVQEGRIPLALPYNYLLPLPQKLSPTLDLGIITNTLAKDKFDTSKESLVSGFVRRDSNIEKAEGYLEISKNWNQEELDNLLNLFWNCKGKAVSFTLELNGEKYLVRFKEDHLNIKFLASDRATGDSIYAIANLGFFVFKAIDPLPLMPQFNSTIEFIDFGLENSENSQPLNSPYSGSSTGGSAGAASGTGSGGAAGGAGGSSVGAAGFAVGVADVPVSIPSSFTPRLITELSGLPVILGTVLGANGHDLYLALPNLPFNGTFNAVFTGFTQTSFSQGLNWRYRNGGAVALLGVRDFAEPAPQDYQVIALTVFPDFSWEIVTIAKSGNIHTTAAANYFYASHDTIYPISQLGATSNSPSNLNVVFGTQGNLLEIPAVFGDNELVEGGVYLNHYHDRIEHVINGVLEIEFDWGANINQNTFYGDSAPGYRNAGYLHTDLRFCPNHDPHDPVNCDVSERTRHVAVFEKLDQILYFVGAFEHSSQYNFTKGTESYFKRNLLIGNRYILNLPTGTLFDIQSWDSVPGTIKHVTAGQNYIAILSQVSGGWFIGFANVSTSSSR